MTTASFRVAPLTSEIDRHGFNCGNEALDRYFHSQVTQDIRRRVTACFVALDSKDQVAGYYTLAPASVQLTDLPPDLAKKLPRYPAVPTIRMGRLAVDVNYRKQGLGGALLANALLRSAKSEITAYAMLVDAKDDQAEAFYRHFGFIPLPDTPLTLFLPLSGIAV